MKLTGAGLVIATAYLLVCAFMYAAQRSLQYFPANKGLTPSLAGLDGVSVIGIATPDGETIQAWHCDPPAGRPTIIYLHGNAGEIGDRPNRFRFYRERGFGVLFVSYRGYGGSTGSPSEEGLVTDAVAAYDWLVARGVDAAEIVVVGESLGTGVAVQLAARRRVAAISLNAPFTSAADIAARSYWWLPVRLLMKDQFRSVDYIGAIAAPLLVQHGDADRIVPFALGRRLFDAAPEPKQFVVLQGGGHDAIFDESVWARESDFFERFAIN